MADESINLGPILDSIRDVQDQLDRLPAPKSAQEEAQVVQLRNTLEALQSLVRALCRAETPGGQTQAIHIPPFWPGPSE